MAEIQNCECGVNGITVRIGGTGTICGTGIIDASQLSKCECIIATPEKQGLVVEGGEAGQFYGVNAEGTAYEFKDFPVADKENLGGIIVGDGLAVEDTGRVSVDFSQMPTDKFEELLKSLRLPQWLTANRTWYVRTDGDDKNDGSANTPDKAFRTIQHAVNYVSENFNLVTYNATIQVANGEYEEAVKLPKYTSSSGYITIRGEGDNTIVKGTDCRLFESVQSAGTYAITNLQCKVYAEKNPMAFPACVSAVGGGTTIYLSAVTLYGKELDTATGEMRLISCDGGSVILNNEVKLHAEGKNSGSRLRCLFASSGGKIEQHGNGTVTSVTGQGECFLLCTLQGSFLRNMAYSPAPRITGSFTGVKYYLGGLSVAVIGALGKDYFPGSIEGSVAGGSVIS